jgi:hypothetical protein
MEARLSPLLPEVVEHCELEAMELPAPAREQKQKDYELTKARMIQLLGSASQHRRLLDAVIQVHEVLIGPTTDETKLRLITQSIESIVLEYRGVGAFKHTVFKGESLTCREVKKQWRDKPVEAVSWEAMQEEQLKKQKKLESSEEEEES